MNHDHMTLGDLLANVKEGCVICEQPFSEERKAEILMASGKAIHVDCLERVRALLGLPI